MSDTWRSFADRSKDINGLLARFYSDLTSSESMRYFGRRLSVVAALVLGDVAACFIGIVAAHQVETLMNPLAGPSYWTHLPIMALIPVFITVGLYSNSLSNPYRRFRRRGLGVLLFVALDAILAGLEVGLVKFIINASLISVFLLVPVTTQKPSFAAALCTLVYGLHQPQSLAATQLRRSCIKNCRTIRTVACDPLDF